LSSSCSLRGVPALRVLALALALGSPGPALALSQINVTGPVFTSLDNGVTMTPNTVSIVTNPNGSHSATQSGSQSEFFTFGPGLSQSFSGTAIASAEAFADEGVLRLRASAGAAASPTAYVAPFPGALGNNPYAAVARSGFFLAFSDNIVLSDPTGTLAVGAPVSYRVTVVIDSVVAGDYSSNVGIAAGLASNPTVGGTFIRSASFQFSFGDHFVFSSVVTGKIGETHVFSVSLVGGANAAASFARGREIENSLFDASNTVTGNLDPITPGLVLQTASGHDYATAVPEPGVFALATSALALGAMLRRRRR
jgi:hypothetical protein